MTTGFQQATIAVTKIQEFEELKAAVSLALNPNDSESFLKQLKSAGLRVRDFDGVLKNNVLERSSKSIDAAKLYEALTVSDQAQMREFYLSEIEKVDPALRAKYQSLYRYY
jgi:hypothetical protein